MYCRLSARQLVDTIGRELSDLDEQNPLYIQQVFKHESIYNKLEMAGTFTQDPEVMKK